MKSYRVKQIYTLLVCKREVKTSMTKGQICELLAKKDC